MVVSLGVPLGVRPSIYSGICSKASLFEEFLLGFLLGAVLRHKILGNSVMNSEGNSLKSPPGSYLENFLTTSWNLGRIFEG